MKFIKVYKSNIPEILIPVTSVLRFRKIPKNLMAYKRGARTEVTLINGEVHYIDETFQEIEE